MDKHRLELFSDGVFAIVLTLLVLDLKPPPHPDGLAAVREIAPGLLVHALTFFLIGTIWIGHHNLLVSAHAVSRGTLIMNLLALFCVTLVPFGARMAAEHPLASVGIGVITASGGFYNFSVLGMRKTFHTRLEEYPELAPVVRRRNAILAGMTVICLAAAALCWVSPWFGYAMVVSSVSTLLFRPAPDLEQAILKRRAEVELASVSADS